MNAMALSQWQEKITVPNIRVLMQSKFLNKEDIPAPIALTIRAVVQDAPRSNGGGPPDVKWLMYFAEHNKALKLNKTTIQTIAASYGDETDAWLGKRVQLYVDPTVMMAGQIVGGVRVRCANPKTGPSGALPKAVVPPQVYSQPAQNLAQGLAAQRNQEFVNGATGEIVRNVDPDFDDDIGF